jgi:hypothetical protein
MTPGSLTYSPLTRLVRELFAVHAEAERLGMPVDEVRERRATAREARSVEDERMTRRTFVRRTAVAGTGVTAAGGWLARPGSGATAPRIVIVGAGLAGLRAAHKLTDRAHPIAATVYEADTTHIRRSLLEPARLLRQRARQRRGSSQPRRDLLVRRRALHVRRGECDWGQHPLRRRAHRARKPGLPRRSGAVEGTCRGRDRPASLSRGGRGTSAPLL